MKWLDAHNRDALTARCGHLFLRIEEHGAYKTKGHPDFEPTTYDWFVEPDDEDKSYRRALVTGRSASLDAAKRDVSAACIVIVTAMIVSLEDPS